MLKLNVMITLPDGRQLFCGEIFTTTPDARGRIQGAFRYAQEYLSNPDAFCLDPVHLPLGAAEIEADRPQGVHGVFEDALPDDLGQGAFIRKVPYPQGRTNCAQFKNFAMLHTKSGFCLSPAYDLVPDIYHNREHCLSFPQGAGTLPPDRKILERIGNVYKVSNPGRIIGEVYQSVSRWQDVFEEYDVPKKDIQRLKPAISRGLSRLEPVW